MRDDEKKVLLQQQIEQEIDFDKLTEFCEHLTDAVQEIFRSCGLYFRIFSRVKSTDSIANKLIRRQYLSLIHIFSSWSRAIIHKACFMMIRIENLYFRMCFHLILYLEFSGLFYYSVIKFL